MIFISQNPLKLIKYFVFLSLLFSLAYADASTLQKLKTGTLTLKNKKTIKTFIAQSDEEQTQGLSGLSSDDLKDNEGMIFVYPQDGKRRFWMPDTYFNLDIFFLSSSFKVLDVERNVLAHPGREEVFIPIARTRTIYCRHVLELKSSSAFSQEIKIGDQLKWSSATLIPGIKQDTHRKQ